MGDRRGEVEEVVRGLADLAKKYWLPILCCASLSRPKDGNDVRPATLSSLRETGEIEYAASTVLLLHRTRESVYINVAKGRNCTLGTVALDFDQQHLVFSERDDQRGIDEEFHALYSATARKSGGGAGRYGAPPDSLFR